VSQQSAPYKTSNLLYLGYAEEYGVSSMPCYRSIWTKLGCVITSDTDSAEMHVRLILKGIAAVVSAEGYEPWRDIRAVGRIEIFGDWHTRASQDRLQDRGLVLFDVTNRPLLHVVNALIGYGGAGPGLTEAIFDELGVDSEIFEQIQARYAGIISTDTPYYVVIEKVQDGDQSHWRWSRGTWSE
jgi:hypothetical protein